MGYTKTPHNYRVYFLSLRMRVVGRDVKFNEDKAKWFPLERELHIPPEEDLLTPNKELQDVVE